MRKISSPILAPVLLFCFLIPAESRGDMAVLPDWYPHACIAGLGGVAGVCTYLILKSVSAPLKALTMDKEEVIIELEDGVSHVFCTFYISNSSNKAFKNKFYFPFAVDQSHKYPKNVAVDYVRDGATVRPKIVHGDKQVLFDLFLTKKTTTCVHVSYTQEFNAHDITYILTSARSYSAPIGEALFRISCPCHWVNARFSFEPDSSSTSKDRICYTIMLRNITPDKELTISWDEDGY
jgi:hypothetical protein